MIIIKIVTEQRDKNYLNLRLEKKLPSSSLTKGGDTICSNAFLMGISLKG
jgi:hypothetical protein